MRGSLVRQAVCVRTSAGHREARGGQELHHGRPVLCRHKVRPFVAMRGVRTDLEETAAFSPAHRAAVRVPGHHAYAGVSRALPSAL